MQGVGGGWLCGGKQSCGWYRGDGEDDGEQVREAVGYLDPQWLKDGRG